eukprot:2085197-Rhodomonas_salina.2
MKHSAERGDGGVECSSDGHGGGHAPMLFIPAPYCSPQPPGTLSSVLEHASNTSALLRCCLASLTA